MIKTNQKNTFNVFLNLTFSLLVYSVNSQEFLPKKTIAMGVNFPNILVVNSGAGI